VRKQRIALEHHVDRALVGRHLGHVLAAEQDAARSRLLEPGQHAQQGRFATARTAQQGKNLALGDRQRDLIDGQRLVKALDHFFGHQKTFFALLQRHTQAPGLDLDSQT